VAVVARTWADALASFGFDVVTVAGEGEADRIVPGLGLDAGGPPDPDDVAAALDDYARNVRQRLADEADRFLADARAEAERARAEADALRAEAEADRDAARKVLAEAHAEADQVRTQVATGHEQLESRRAELREVERELRERIAGLDSVFRAVLRDDA